MLPDYFVINAENIFAKEALRWCVMCCVRGNIMHVLASPNLVTRDSGARALLHCRLLLDPRIVIRLRHDVQIRLHVVMPKAAKLRAHNLITANFGRREMQLQIKSGHKILLNSQLPHVKRMSNILCVHEQTDFFVDRNSHLSSDDVVF